MISQHRGGGGPEEVKKFFVEINRNNIFDLRNFTLQACFIERIALVNHGVGVCSEAEALWCETDKMY
jgi:hypothetical protein